MSFMITTSRSILYDSPVSPTLSAFPSSFFFAVGVSDFGTILTAASCPVWTFFASRTRPVLRNSPHCEKVPELPRPSVLPNLQGPTCIFLFPSLFVEVPEQADA
jgi:hypothetical protein